jgi:hypothetical protein
MGEPPDPASPRELNHARWEGLAAAHGDDAYYDSDALVAGADSMTPEERSLAGDVTGLNVLFEPDGMWRLGVSGELLPTLFALRATRPA